MNKLMLNDRDILALAANDLPFVANWPEGLQRALTLRLASEEHNSHNNAYLRWLDEQEDRLAFQEKELTDTEPTWEDLRQAERLR